MDTIEKDNRELKTHINNIINLLQSTRETFKNNTLTIFQSRRRQHPLIHLYCNEFYDLRKHAVETITTLMRKERDPLPEHLDIVENVIRCVKETASGLESLDQNIVHIGRTHFKRRLSSIENELESIYDELEAVIKIAEKYK